MVDIDGILVAAIRTMWLQVDGPESPPRGQIEVETARRVRIALEREGIIMSNTPNARGVAVFRWFDSNRGA